MKKSFKLNNLGCANCAAKMEDKINKIDGVNCSISFMTQRINLESENMEETLDKAQSIISKIEPDCKIAR